MLIRSRFASNAARPPLQERSATDVQRQMRAAMAPAPYASSSEDVPTSRPATQPRSMPEQDDPAATAAYEPRDEPRGLGLLTRLARQRGVVIVSSSGSDRSSGCAESPDRYDLNAALQVRSWFSRINLTPAVCLCSAPVWRELGALLICVKASDVPNLLICCGCVCCWWPAQCVISTTACLRIFCP